MAPAVRPAGSGPCAGRRCAAGVGARSPSCACWRTSWRSGSGPRTWWSTRPGRARPGTGKPSTDRPGAPGAGAGRDPRHPVRQADRHLPHLPGRPAGGDGQRQPGRPLGRAGGLLRAGPPRADHARRVHRRRLAVHRHPGHRPGHLHDLPGRRPRKVRRQPGRAPGADQRLRRHGRGPAAGGHAERRGGHRRGGGSAQDRAAGGLGVLRPGFRGPGRDPAPVPGRAGRQASPCRSDWWATPRRSCRSCCAAG